jgi:hypothetical protein
MARHLHPDLAPARSTTTIRCGGMGRTTLGLGSKSVNHVAGLKCQGCPRPVKFGEGNLWLVGFRGLHFLEPGAPCQRLY